MTRDDLRGIIEGITDEQLKRILDINSADIGRAKSAEAQLRTSLEEAEGKVSALEQSQREAEEMKIKYEELQKVADQRAEQDRITTIRNRFKEASEDVTFLNSFTREGVFSQFSQAIGMEENKDKSDKEIFEQLTKSDEDLFAEDNRTPRVVDSTLGFGGDLTDGDIREIMGLSSQLP